MMANSDLPPAIQIDPNQLNNGFESFFLFESFFKCLPIYTKLGNFLTKFDVFTGVNSLYNNLLLV